MRQIINREDLRQVEGQFVVELQFGDQEELEVLTKTTNSGFWLEKRIRFVSSLSTRWVSEKITKDIEDVDGSVILLNGLYYTNSPLTINEFLNRFNGVNEDGTKAKRFMRLLTRKELDWLNVHLKNRD